MGSGGRYAGYGASSKAQIGFIVAENGFSDRRRRDRFLVKPVNPSRDCTSSRSRSTTLGKAVRHPTGGRVSAAASTDPRNRRTVGGSRGGASPLDGTERSCVPAPPVP